MSELIDVFTKAAKAMRSASDAGLTRHGVRVGQNLVLKQLWETDGLTPGDVAQRMHVTTPTVVKMATRMAAAGLISRRRDDRDGRLVRLYLTDRGRAVREEVERQQKLLEDQATAGLTADERRYLVSALEKIVRNLDGVPPADDLPADLL
jgi:DNA-binding MarR family transcriptional regulator